MKIRILKEFITSKRNQFITSEDCEDFFVHMRNLLE